jgi:protease-4
MVQDLINETFNRFKTVVRTGRHAANKTCPTGQPLAANWESYADGRVLTGKQALSLGFVDELGNFDVAAKRARDMVNAPNASLISYREPFNLGSFLNLLGQSETRSLKVDIGFNPIRLKAGHMYYIAPMVLE